jgi:murein DD-endopeptidase MepM/ murein hydrolase activator NlpD
MIRRRAAIIIFLLLMLGICLRPPVGGKLTSWYGIRFEGDRVFHTGSDISVPIGTALYPVSWGTVSETGFTERNGNFIKISHLPGVESRYLHLSSLKTSRGQKVGHGTVIGYSGNTGYSTGPHIHFEIRVFNIPLPAYTLCLPGKLINWVLSIF